MDKRIKTEITSEILSASDLKRFINYDDTNASEIELIDDMIKSVRTHLERRMSTSFAQRTYEVFFKSSDSPYILPVFPIISIDTVETIDIEGDTEELELNSGYFKKGTYEVEILPVLATYDLKVTCKAGYGHTDTEILPLDIVGAIKSQVFQWYDNRDDFYEGNFLGMIGKIIRSYKREW